MRNIFIVDAMQVVVSDSHPEGLFSHISGYPKNFDSRNYEATEENPDGNVDRALRVAKAEYYSALSLIYSSTSRAMGSVTLERADGRQLMCESVGWFPNMTPESESEPEIATDPEMMP